MKKIRNQNPRKKRRKKEEVAKQQQTNELTASPEDIHEVAMQIHEYKTKLNATSLKYRFQVNEVVPYWKNKYDELFASNKELKSKLALYDTFSELDNDLIELQNKYLKLLQELEDEKENTKKTLNEINLKYRHQVNVVVPHLKQENERLKFQIKQVQVQQKQNVENLQHKISYANQQVINTRKTLSFKIGYKTSHVFEHWYNVFLLPIDIYSLAREHQKNQKAKNQNSSFNQVTVKEQKVIPEGKVSTEKVSTLDTNVKKLFELRMACVMDTFTFSSYSPECDLFQLTPENWKKEIESFNPEILFIESAWRGKDDLWGNKIGHNSLELQNIIQWCKNKNIPTLFWNKEDPIHFETFLNTAQQFDYVFTTDIDCINRYKSALGHNRVYLLPFAAQPTVHNPIEKYDRKDAFCFAGAYYVRYPERTRDLGNFVSYLSELKPVEIYDRNYGKDDPNYMFPDDYKPFIVGTLTHSEIDKAYKGYNYAINLNSIKQSQTMFARRIFELLASNTISVSNFSRGIRLLFGDLVFTSDNGEELLSRLKQINNNDTDAKKFRLSALRKVMKEHTYEDRFAYIVSKLQDAPMQKLLPSIAVIAQANTEESLEVIPKQFAKQSYEYKKLYIVMPNKMLVKQKLDDDITLISESEAKKKKPSELVKEQWIGVLSVDDYYGENYLMDLALSTRYTEAKAIGKSSYYSVNSNGEIVLLHPNQQYNEAKKLLSRSSIIDVAHIKETSLLKLLAKENNAYTLDNMFAIDEFNYCANAMTQSEDKLAIVDDLSTLNRGLELDELITRSEKIEPLKNLEDKAPVWDVKTLSELFRSPSNKSVEFESDGIIMDVSSTLPDAKHEYIYARKDFTLEELGYKEKVRYYLDTTPGLNIQVVTFFLDENNQKISHAIKHANINNEIDIPLGTEKIRFGLRIYAGGHASIKALVLGHRPTAPAEVIGTSKYLVLTNHYPSYEDLYRNGFVHSRVKEYQKSGIEVDIFRLRLGENLSYHEFQNIDVTTGSKEALHKMLSSGKYKKVLVHFLDEDMWQVLQEFIDDIDVIVWIHGSEIQPWYRRDFNYKDEQERNDAKKVSNIRMKFWRELLTLMPERLKFVFVSEYFAEEVMEDTKITIPKKHYEVIHNPINIDVFDYIKKDKEQRKRLLSIRPYASAKYANDLSVKAIVLLSKKEWFSELDILILGDGKMFDEILEPLRSFKNVTIQRRFLSQPEIATLHKQYGVFLTPTRMDAQGVSRDEAMSSGLVPVTNAVTAIPEFVDDTCGILAPGEDAQAMADGIERLYNSPELFESMSKNAADRVRKQTSPEFTINKEIVLIVKKRTL